jgi:HAE1 family hydrophobic/amphiphilic exporter-1
MAELEAGVGAIPGVQTLFTSVGRGGFGSAQEQNGQIAVGLADKSQRAPLTDIIARTRRIGATIPDMQLRTQVPSPLIGGGGSPIDVGITRPDFTVLNDLTNQVLPIVSSTPGAVEVRNTTLIPAPEYRAVVDRQKAADQGMTAQTVANTLRAAVQGVVASELRPEGQDQVDILLQLKGAENLSAGQIGAIPILTSRGTIVRLDQVSTIVPSASPGQIARFNRAREIEVQANVTDRWATSCATSAPRPTGSACPWATASRSPARAASSTWPSARCSPRWPCRSCSCTCSWRRCTSPSSTPWPS